MVAARPSRLACAGLGQWGFVAGLFVVFVSARRRYRGKGPPQGWVPLGRRGRAGVFWCFHCYGLNERPSGPCVHCGKPIGAPADISVEDQLVWSLGHPDSDRALLAARRLGVLRAVGAAPALWRVVEKGRDPYLAAEALRSLVLIEGSERVRSWLEPLAETAPLLVREAAREAFGEGRD